MRPQDALDRRGMGEVLGCIHWLASLLPGHTPSVVRAPGEPVAEPSARDLWLCVPASRRVCPVRTPIEDHSTASPDVDGRPFDMNGAKITMNGGRSGSGGRQRDALPRRASARRSRPLWSRIRRREAAGRGGSPGRRRSPRRAVAARPPRPRCPRRPRAGPRAWASRRSRRRSRPTLASRGHGRDERAVDLDLVRRACAQVRPATTSRSRSRPARAAAQRRAARRAPVMARAGSVMRTLSVTSSFSQRRPSAVAVQQLRRSRWAARRRARSAVDRFTATAAPARRAARRRPGRSPCAAPRGRAAHQRRRPRRRAGTRRAPSSPRSGWRQRTSASTPTIARCAVGDCGW